MSRLKIGPRNGSEWAGVRSASRRGRVSRAVLDDYDELQQAQQDDPHIGLLSDDGRWWWDGQKWAPNLPSPPTRSPRSGGRPGRRRHRLRLVALVLVLVALVAVVAAHLQQVLLGAAWVLVAAGVYVMATAGRRRSRRRSRGILAAFAASFIGARTGGNRR